MVERRVPYISIISTEHRLVVIGIKLICIYASPHTVGRVDIRIDTKLISYHCYNATMLVDCIVVEEETSFWASDMKSETITIFAYIAEIWIIIIEINKPSLFGKKRYTSILVFQSGDRIIHHNIGNDQCIWQVYLAFTSPVCCLTVRVCLLVAFIDELTARFIVKLAAWICLAVLDNSV